MNEAALFGAVIEMSDVDSEGATGMKFSIKTFCKNEHGAVTVDWVVITAVLVALGGLAASTVTTGADVSITSSSVLASLPLLPSGSVAVTDTSYVPSASAVSVLSARLQVPSPSFVPATV